MGRKNYQNIARLFIALLLFTACEKVNNNNGTGNGQLPPSNNAERNVYVVCEGSLGNGNASLWAHNKGKSITYNDVYKSANGELLGDVFQSMTRIEDKLYLCVNNSDKIVVLNYEDKKKVGTINVSKPRYILPISPTKAYVSSIFSNKVHIINPQTFEVKGTIEMPYQNPEGMVLLNNKAYVCCWDTSCSSLYAIDIVTDKISDTLAIAGGAPHDIAIDREQRLWVMAGNAAKKKWATLTYLNPVTNNISRSYQFPALADPTRMVFDNSGNRLYYIMVDYSGATKYNGVYTMQTFDIKLPNDPFLAAAPFQYFWGLAIDPVTDDIYVSDPKGFVQQGSVSIYTAQGTKLGTFNVGVGPGNFYFDK